MSYILDALLKADKERRGNASPTLHSVHQTPPVRRPVLIKRWASPTMIALLGGVLLLAGWLVGAKLGAPRSATPAASPSPSATQPAEGEAQITAADDTQPKGASSAVKPPGESSAAPLAATARMPPAPSAGMPAKPGSTRVESGTGIGLAPSLKQQEETTNASTDTSALAAAAKAPSAAPAPSQDATSPPAPARLSAAVKSSKVKRAAVVKPPAAADPRPQAEAKATEPKPSSRLVDISALPPEVRKEAESQIKISGYSQSTDGSEPIAIINDRVRRAGESIAPDMKLEAISPDGVIIAYKGYRFLARPY